MHLFAVFVGERVLDANLLIRVIHPSMRISALPGSHRLGDFIIFSTVPCRVALCLSLMACPFEVQVCRAELRIGFGLSVDYVSPGCSSLQFQQSVKKGTISL